MKPLLRTALLSCASLTLIIPHAPAAHAGLFGSNKDKTSGNTTTGQIQETRVIETPLLPGNDKRPGSFADLAEILLPTVVNISSTVKIPDAQSMENIIPHFPEGSPFEDFFERFMERQGPGMNNGPIMPSSSLGSGFIIDAEQGYIITNSHVIKDAEQVRVTLHNDETVEAQIIGRDEKTDLAVLKIDPTGKDLTAAAFGKSDAIRVGDWILAIGNPFGLGGTVTAGIISARARDINSGPYDDYLQTDASINRGNSGGPMFNLQGEVIGINTAIFSPTGGSVGIGFAIPSSLAEPVINQLIEYGHTRRGWLGVRIQSVTDEIAESLGLNKARGALVASVTPGGPAEKAGIEAGDIILEFNGTKIDEMKRLPRVVAETKIDTDVSVVVLRKGQEQNLSVKIGELEKAEESGLLDSPTQITRKGTDLEDLKISVGEITGNLREEYAIDQTIDSGILITDVDPSSNAAAQGIIPGDVIVEVNQTAVKTVADVQKAIAEAKTKKRTSVLLLINRDSDIRFVAVKLETKK